MKRPVVRIFIGVLTGILVLAGVIWLLRHALADHQKLYAGRTLSDWAAQLKSPDAATTNKANDELNAAIIPGLVDQMFHDTNDSKLKLSLVKTLNAIPGAHVYFTSAWSRRAEAVRDLGMFGPSAKAAVPSLVQMLNGPEAGLHEAAIQSLGNIHTDPDVVIPLLVANLADDNLNDDAAYALANYGSLARQAFPKIVPLLHARDPHARGAASYALKRIDPEAAAKVLADLAKKNAP